MKKTKSLVSLFLAIVLTLSIFTAVPLNANAATNTWNPDNGVYEISTEEDLFAFRASLQEAITNKTYYSGITVELKSDITLTKEWKSLLVTQDAEFRGIFNGNNHVISNIVNTSEDDYCGFFPALFNAEINDLTLDNILIDNTKECVGAFTSCAYGEVKISNCHITGNSKIVGDSLGGYISGFVGLLFSDGNLTVDSSTIGADVKIQGDTVGGFLGFSYNASSTFTNCVNNASIYDSSKSYYTGLAGIVAYSDQTSNLVIDRCANHGEIAAKSHNSSAAIGGIAGFVCTSQITNCYNTGSVSSLDSPGTGGIVGLIRNDTIYGNTGALKNCYNVGTVTAVNSSYGNGTGGVVGVLTCERSSENKIHLDNCYNFADVTGGDFTGSVIGWSHYSKFDSAYSIKNSKVLGCIFLGSAVNTVGYFSSANTDGEIVSSYVYLSNNLPTADNEKVIAHKDSYTIEGGGEKTGKNLLNTLNEWVEKKNEEAGEEIFLTWKMTNPASEDGSKGVTVHPMFGVESTAVNYHINNDDKDDMYADDIFNPYIQNLNVNIGDTIEEFYDIPKLKDPDGYIFKGWYYDADSDANPVKFGTDKYEAGKDIYARWEKVGEIAKDPFDDKVLPDIMAGKYSDFGLFGVQIRPEKYKDKNVESGTVETPGGLRFITSLSNNMLNNIGSLNDKKVNGHEVEYGYITASKDIVEEYVKHYSDLGYNMSDYALQYKGTEVNGVDTTQKNSPATDYRYITNVDCTSREGLVDHKSFTEYRLSTMVITYENDTDGTQKDTDICARAYIRYYDANGLLRTFYNDYGGTTTYGGCCTSYNEAKNGSADNEHTYYKNGGEG